MAVLHNVGAQIEKIDQQILNLVEQRAALWQEAVEEDPESLTAGHDAEAILFWISEAEHRGLDEAGAERVGKAVLSLCRKMGES